MVNKIETRDVRPTGARKPGISAFAEPARTDRSGSRSKPGAAPPVEIHDLAATLRLPFGDQRGEREAAELLKTMLAAGLSRYEPDPLAALDEAEAKRAAP